MNDERQVTSTSGCNGRVDVYDDSEDLANREWYYMLECPGITYWAESKAELLAFAEEMVAEVRRMPER